MRDYRLSFVRVCMDELSDFGQEELRYNSLAVRLSKLDNNEFTKFMKEIEPEGVKRKPIEIDHKAQMQKAQG